MRLKPSKCRTFSIQSGSPSVLDFYVDENRIPSIYEEEQKFLGKVIFFSGKSSETFNLLHNDFKDRLENINNTKVRSEYKLWIYQNYFISSVRFLLSIHDVTKTDIAKLDNLTHRYLKMWAGLPPSATNAVFHARESLNILSISDLYNISHGLSHALIRLKGDEKVNHAVNCTIETESEYIRKSSATVLSESEYITAIQRNSIGGTLPSFPDGRWDRQKKDFLKP